MPTDEELLRQKIWPVPRPIQLETPLFPERGLRAAAVDDPLGLTSTRDLFDVDGEGLTVAVLDTGLRDTHVDFVGRVVAQRNFTPDNGGDPDDAEDGHGHGTHIAGLIAAGGVHWGVAPKAGLVPVKVLQNEGDQDIFAKVNEGLGWVLDTAADHGTRLVVLALGDGESHVSDLSFVQTSIHTRIQELTERKIPVVAAAGNGYFRLESQQGMAFPAVLREVVSVGAVYSSSLGSQKYSDGGIAFSTGRDRFIPFSQRLHETLSPDPQTGVFAPGAKLVSSGIVTDQGQAGFDGTSQAAAMVAGILLLLQQYHFRVTRRFPAVEELVRWVRDGGVEIFDGDDEDDNVVNSQRAYRRVDPRGAFRAMRLHLEELAFLEARKSGQTSASGIPGVLNSVAAI